MSLFRRTCKTDIAAACPHTPVLDNQHNTAQSLKAALEHHAAHRTTASPPPHARNSSSATTLSLLGLAALAGLAAYTAARRPRVPPGIRPLDHFALPRFMGKWYELARIEHSFERGLQRTQAEYHLNPNGSLQVINRGFDPLRNEWRVSRGKAYPVFGPEVAALRVSFFGPFFGGYNVVALDVNYQWAMVVGSTLDYFWILSRTPSLPDGVEDQLLRHAHLLGVDIQKVLWVHQDGVNPTGSYQ